MYSPFDMLTKRVVSTSLSLSMISHGMGKHLRYKSEIFERFKKFRYKIEKQIKKNLKIFLSDRGCNIREINFLIIS